jgi:hypothetical protein
VSHILFAELFALASCAMTGCSEEDPFSPETGREEIVFAVNGDFRPGDIIVATLENRSSRPVGYNLCLADLELRVGTDWQRVRRHPEGHACTLILLALEPGESTSLQQPVLDEHLSGVYRFQTEVEWPLEDYQRFHGVHRFV